MLHLHRGGPDNKEYFFKVTAKNGKTLMHSETYKTKRSALKGIAALVDAVNELGLKDHTLPKLNVKLTNSKYDALKTPLRK